MRKLSGVIKALTVMIIALSLSTLAEGEEIGESLPKIRVNTIESVKIKNGINYIDLNGDGKKDMGTSGYRGNLSAHSFSVYSFYVYKKLELEISYEWQIVSVGGGGGAQAMIFVNMR